MRDAGRLPALLVMTFSAWSATACSDGCPTLEACDIRSTSCQERTREVAVCLRGSSAGEVSVEVVDGEAFVAQKVQESTTTPETADQRDFRRGMALLSLMPESDEAGDTVRERWEAVAAFYSPETDRITVLDRGWDLDSPGSVTLLLHEILHALQDGELDLEREEHYETYDRGLAFRGMIEGEAVLYKDLATLEGYGRDPDDTDWEAIFRQFRAREWARARGNASPFEFAYHRFAYAFGGDYLNRAWRAGGNAAVRDVFAGIPASTRQILAGYGARAPDDLPWKEDPDEVGMPLLSAEFEHVDIIHLGTWLFEVWKDLWNANSTHSAGFSDSGFAGDVLNVFRLPASGDVAAVWRLRFGSPDQADALIASLRADPMMTTSVDGRDVIVVADTRGAPLQSFVDALTWRAVTPEDSADPASQAAFQPSSGTVVCAQALHGE